MLKERFWLVLINIFHFGTAFPELTWFRTFSLQSFSN